MNIYNGFLRGNLFDNLYDGYKNYKPRVLVPTSEKGEALLNIDQLSFASHELNLYLDVHPNDMAALNSFNKYRMMLKTEMDDYQKKYGPISLSSDYMNSVPFSWVSDEWFGGEV